MWDSKAIYSAQSLLLLCEVSIIKSQLIIFILSKLSFFTGSILFYKMVEKIFIITSTKQRMPGLVIANFSVDGQICNLGIQWKKNVNSTSLTI